MTFADLHLHSRFSDGTYTPEELARRAHDLALSVIALTDHDTVEGCEPTARACADLAIGFIAGTELTAQHNGNELHLLAYGVDTRDPALLNDLIRFQTARQNRVREMVARINQLGIPLEADAVFALANCRSPGRPHVGRALVQAGFCANLDEAFERFLKKNRPAFVPKLKMSALRAIELVHQAHGLAVMAHPGLNRSDDVIPDLVDSGLDGLECFHPKHSHAASEHYLQLANHYRLLVTGGSDCHGLSKGKPLIGSVKLPLAYVEQLRIRAAAHALRADPPPLHPAAAPQPRPPSS